MTDFRTLMELYFDGEATPDQEGELCRWLAEDPAKRREFLIESQLHGGLRTVFEAERREVAGLQRPGLLWGRRGLAVAAAALVMAGLGVAYWLSRQVVATLADVSGGVVLQSVVLGATQAKAGCRVYSWQEVVCALKGSGATLKCRDGSLLLLGAEGRVRLSWVSQQYVVALGQGELVASVVKQRPGAPFVIRTASAVATVLGTRLKISAGPDSTRLEVIEGLVKLERVFDGASVEVAGGQYAVAGKDARLAVAAVASVAGSLSGHWLARDVGGVKVAGSAVYSNGVFLLSGSGDDIWNGRDQFHFVYQVAGGDCEISARVLSVQNTDPWAKAGIMIRETLDADSANAALVVMPEFWLNFQWRIRAGAQTEYIAEPRARGPCWLKLVKSGAELSGYCSQDGTEWKKLGSRTLPVGKSYYAGLVVSSHSNGVLAAAVIDSVLVRHVD